MKRKLFVGLFALLPIFSFSQSIVDTQKKIDENFANFVLNNKFEKLYLHTDKSNYIAGEDIWFKGYLTDATLLNYKTATNYIYVDLCSMTDSLVSRHKIKRDTVYGFYGNMTIPYNLKGGDYFLRAYSWLMLNDDNFIFRKKIRVGNIAGKFLSTQVRYDIEDGGETIVTSIKLEDYENKPYAKKRIYYTFSDADFSFFDPKLGPVNEKFKSKVTDEDGVIVIKSKYSRGNKDVLKIYNDSRVDAYNQTFVIPNMIQDFDVKFMPEGGDLISGTVNRVALKSIASDGFSADVSGYIFNSKSDTVCQIKTIYKGLGDFYFEPIKGEKYYAELMTTDSLKKKFDLPEITDNIALKIIQKSDKIIVALNKDTDINTDNLILMATNGTFLAVNTPFDASKDMMVFDKEDFRTGITNFILADSLGNPVSERMIFINRSLADNVNVKANKEFYDRRDKVKLDISMSGINEGIYSISVSDDYVPENKKDRSNIFTNLLLTSELKGYIEDPYDFFIDGEHNANYKLDLLMLTHGWTRYSVEKVLAGNFPNQLYQQEEFMKVSGTVTDLSKKKPYEYATVLTLLPEILSKGRDETRLPDISTDSEIFSLTAKDGIYVSFPFLGQYLIRLLS